MRIRQTYPFQPLAALLTALLVGGCGYDTFTDARDAGNPGTQSTPDGGRADGSTDAGDNRSVPDSSCGTNNGGCSADATCTETGSGTLVCTCKAGYVGDGYSCTVPSCAGSHPGSGHDCGLTGTNDCCASLPLPAGTFQADTRSTNFPAILSAFRLDAYEVTVGRFRNFVSAVAPATGKGWQPIAGSGKQTHLNGGNGLSNVLGPTGYESGWDPSWPSLPTSIATWNANLASAGVGTWTPTPAANENLPISNVSWFEAYAFCIWDGGFLPSYAEWDYAALGGSDERQTPWCATSPCTFDDTYLVYCGGSCTGPQPVGRKTRGDGKWGQGDLYGNVAEWILDWVGQSAGYTCLDCAVTVAPTGNPPATAGARVVLGYDYSADGSKFSEGGVSSTPSLRYPQIGLRCARTP